MKIKILAIGLILTNVFFSPSQLLAAPAVAGLPILDNQIGIVAAVRGVVKVSSPEKVGKVIASGESIYLGDEISTDGQGNLQILLLDETIFTIGPNSAMVIDKFIYNPASHDGAVKAKIMKGVFRFVTGKIGQKSPKQVEVDLPSGTIGIRGTIVAGEVTGKKSTVILFGPGENNNTRHRTGSFVLSNKQDGKTNETLVNKTGFGATIEGEGFAPTKPFRVPAEQMNRVAAALSPVSAADNGNQSVPASTGSEKFDGSQKSATEQSGQDKAQGQKFAGQAGLIGKVMQALDDESGEAAQNITEGSGFKFTDGPTSRNQLQAFAQSMGGGVHRFEKKGVALVGGGFADFAIDIDFGARSVGGGNSNVTGDLGSGSNSFIFELPSRPFGFGSDNADFQFNNISNTDGSSACKTGSCQSANISLAIDNVGGGFANGGHVGITIFDDQGNQTRNGDALATQVDGATI